MNQIISQSSVKVITLGCRLNAYESEVMRDHAQTQGLENAVIINTCAVTNEAERQSRQAVRKAKRENPDAKIIVAGCSAQLHADIYAAMPEVDRVLGNHDKMQQINFAPQLPQKIVVSDIMAIKETAQHLISGFENRVRAFIEIQNGCDHRCTFCSIPFGRGNNRSAPVAEIVRQVKKLVDENCQEIVFTGVDITGYGADLPGTPTLGQLIRRTFHHVPELLRLRLSSLDPVEIDDELFQLIAHEPRLMPHFHLSLQAGDNMILKRMKRRHSREQAIDVVHKIKQLRPDAVFGADIIAGFPTETPDMFLNSLAIIDECDLTHLHVFPYSPREGTPAARMPQVNRLEIKSRAEQLRRAGEKRLQNFLINQIDHEVSVLVERDLKGRTQHYAAVVFEDELTVQPFIGSIIKARITDVEKDHLRARIIL